MPKFSEETGKSSQTVALIFTSSSSIALKLNRILMMMWLINGKYAMLVEQV